MDHAGPSSQDPESPRRDRPNTRISIVAALSAVSLVGAIVGVAILATSRPSPVSPAAAPTTSPEASLAASPPGAVVSLARLDSGATTVSEQAAFACGALGSGEWVVVEASLDAPESPWKLMAHLPARDLGRCEIAPAPGGGVWAVTAEGAGPTLPTETWRVTEGSVTPAPWGGDVTVQPGAMTTVVDRTIAVVLDPSGKAEVLEISAAADVSTWSLPKLPEGAGVMSASIDPSGRRWIVAQVGREGGVLTAELGATVAEWQHGDQWNRQAFPGMWPGPAMRDGNGFDPSTLSAHLMAILRKGETWANVKLPPDFGVLGLDSNGDLVGLDGQTVVRQEAIGGWQAIENVSSDIPMLDGDRLVVASKDRVSEIDLRDIPETSPVPETTPTPMAMASSVAFFDAKRGLVAGATADGRGAVWRTDDGGQSWAEIVVGSPALTSFTVEGPSLAWAVCADASAGGSPCIQASKDGGLSWQRVSDEALWGLSFGDAKHGWGVTREVPGGIGVKIVTTSDGGATWAPLSSEPCADVGTPASVSLVSELHGWVGCAGEGGAGSAPKSVVESVDGGQTWTVRSRASLYLDEPNVGSLWAGGYLAGIGFRPHGVGLLWMNRGGTSLSVDRGRTWRGIPDTGNDAEVVPLSASVATDTDWYILLWNGNLQRDLLVATHDGGKSWQQVSVVPPG